MESHGEFLFDFSADINDRLPYYCFFILFLLLQEKNQKKQLQGALYVLLPQSNPPPCISPGRTASGPEHLNLNPVQAENVPIFCLKVTALKICTIFHWCGGGFQRGLCLAQRIKIFMLAGGKHTMMVYTCS